MRSFLTAWMLFLLSVLCLPALAQEDEDPLFGDEPAAETPADEAPAKETPSEEAPAEETPADEPKSETGDDLFGEPDAPAAVATDDKPAPPARDVHSQEEIIAELTKRNKLIAQQMTDFIELNKQLFKQAVQSGNKDELMAILREYGPAVIRTKQLWTAVIGNPAKYNTWLGSESNQKAWARFHNSWNSLYGFTDRFAAVDMDVADKVSEGLATLGTSFDDYNAWVDEWDAEIGNDTRAFARGDDHLNQLNEEQMREEEGADSEIDEAAADQTREEEDETAPSGVEEAQEDTEKTDAEILSEDEESADAADDEEEMKDEEAIDGESSEEPPAEEAPADEEIDFGEG